MIRMTLWSYTTLTDVAPRTACLTPQDLQLVTKDEDLNVL